MRAKLGLPSRDHRIGLAAHDFAQLANAPRVVLTRALRREGSPTVASRWLWRLMTLMQGAKTTIPVAEDHLAWARALDAPSAVVAARPPKPRPPAGRRIDRLSVTQVETLIRDPYAIYARRILGLDYLAPVGMEAGYAERGVAVHKAIERFGDGEDSDVLLQLLDEELRKAGTPPERCAAENARLQATVDALIDWFAGRRALAAEVHREKAARLDVDGVALTARADRIEIGPGHAAIFDFKTGQPPTEAQVTSGLAPQLPLEAAMLARGAFEGVAAATATELAYWRVGNNEPTPQALRIDPQAEAEKALAALRGLLARYAQPEQPFLSKPRVQFVKPYDEYDQLARRKEWADEKPDE
jgi:ATP-dependent helicase/nuclease subunit B